MLASNIKTVATRYGEMSYYADDLLIGASLREFGEYSQLEVDFLAQIIKPGWSVFDIGANIGAITVALARLVGPEGRVVAFEPQPESFSLLNSNCIIDNNVGNVTTLQLALGDRDDEVVVPPLATIVNKNYGAMELGGAYDFGDKVKIRRLDDCDQPLINVSLMKIDVEGMEVEVLKGAAGMIERCRPVLYVEDDRPERSQEMYALLRSMDYAYFKHSPPMYNPKNFHAAPPNDLFNYDSINLLAIPKEQVPAYAAVIEQLQPPSEIVAKSRQIGKSGWAGMARCGGIGDNLIAASVLKPLKEMGYKVEVISQEPMSCLYENNPYIDKLSVHDKEDWPQNDIVAWQRWFATRAKEYDRFANLSHTGEALHAAFTGMTQFWWPAKFRRKIFAGSYLESAHDLLDVPYSFGRLFWPTEKEISWARNVMAKIARQPVIGWCIGGTRIDKIYPQAPMVIARLIKEVGASVVMFGKGGADTPEFGIAKQNEEMVKTQNGSTDHLYHIGKGDTPLRESLAWLQMCDLVVGPDTGPMWAVAMEPMGKIMLHSHASVENITKHWVNTVSLSADQGRVPCWPCHRLQENDAFVSGACVPNAHNNGVACISDIAPDAIIAAASKLLAK